MVLVKRSWYVMTRPRSDAGSCEGHWPCQLVTVGTRKIQGWRDNVSHPKTGGKAFNLVSSVCHLRFNLHARNKRSIKKGLNVFPADPVHDVANVSS